jgi:hypothetical protein
MKKLILFLLEFDIRHQAMRSSKKSQSYIIWKLWFCRWIIAICSFHLSLNIAYLFHASSIEHRSPGFVYRSCNSMHPTPETQVYVRKVFLSILPINFFFILLRFKSQLV